jgi:hypothetical protein
MLTFKQMDSSADLVNLLFGVLNCDVANGLALLATFVSYYLII